MTEAEFFAIYFESISIVQANFEFWLTATFAFTLAFHFAGKDMSSYFSRMLKTLYIMSVLVFFMNWLNSGMLALNMMEKIQSSDPGMVVRPIGGANGPIVIMLLMFFGSVGAVYFSVKTNRNSSEGDT